MNGRQKRRTERLGKQTVLFHFFQWPFMEMLKHSPFKIKCIPLMAELNLLQS